MEQRERVLKKQEQLTLIEKKITNRIEQMKAALSGSYGQVVVKDLPQRKIVSLDRSFSINDDMEPLIRDLSKEHSLDDAIFLGKVGVSVSKNGLLQGRFNNFQIIHFFLFLVLLYF